MRVLGAALVSRCGVHRSAAPSPSLPPIWMRRHAALTCARPSTHMHTRTRKKKTRNDAGTRLHPFTAFYMYLTICPALYRLLVPLRLQGRWRTREGDKKWTRCVPYGADCFFFSPLACSPPLLRAFNTHTHTHTERYTHAIATCASSCFSEGWTSGLWSPRATRGVRTRDDAESAKSPPQRSPSPSSLAVCARLCATNVVLASATRACLPLSTFEPLPDPLPLPRLRRPPSPATVIFFLPAENKRRRKED